MNKSERHDLITRDLTHEPALRVNEMARRYRVSSETIRRDLNELNEKGLINRTYGGAVRALSEEPRISEREKFNIPERAEVARAAVALIQTNDVLLIGGGITTKSFARALADTSFRLTVITTSYGVATELWGNNAIHTFMLPGEFNGDELQVEGTETLNALLRLRGTKAIIGASGVSSEGISDVAIPAGRIYETMSQQAEKTLVVADSSKFGLTALAAHVRWGPQVSLVTNRLPGEGLRTAISAAGSAIVIV